MSFSDTRNEIISQIYKAFNPYLKESSDGIDLIDPLENKVIGFHYGETHFAIAFIIFGYLNKNEDIYYKGEKLLNSFLNNLKDFQKVPEYHWDFNNFALCVLVEFLNKQGIELHNIPMSKLKKIILDQKDSTHGTINWMPMRAYVNWCKFIWTKEEKYNEKVKTYLNNIKQATYKDGFIEDFLPKGKSFNFQYHIYTTAMMDYLSRRLNNVERPSLSIRRICDFIDVEGDINYLGRGCNQIFAWGPVLYILYCNNLFDELEKVSSYFEPRIRKALNNYNLILCDLPGKYKAWWWDYHYASVYFGHLIFWLVLTFIEEARDFKFEEKMLNKSVESGVSIIKDSNNFSVIFQGRKHYLAERGPVLANLGTKHLGTIFKGPLGPYGGQFGNKYSNYHSTIINYFGPVYQRIIMGYTIEKNLFPKSITVEYEQNKIKLKYNLGKLYKSIYFSLPIFIERNLISIKVLADEKEQFIYPDGDYIGPYGLTKHYRTQIMSSEIISVIITEA